MLPHHRLKAVQELVQRKFTICLDSYRQNTPSHLYDAVSYALLSPGKRLRAYLVLEVARLFDIPEAEVIAIALSVECMHCYSLVHDDLPCMDDSPLRRGQPTLHVKFDEATALLAGTSLLVMAIDLINKAPTISWEQRHDLISMLISASGMQGMMGGQMLDILGEGRLSNLDEIQRMQRLKTGCLIEFSIIAPVMHNIKAKAHLSLLTDFAHDLGLAYQIADDLDDAELDQDDLGKPTNRDTALDKSTYISVMGVKAARAQLNQLVDKIKQNLHTFGDKAPFLLWVAQRLVTR